MQFGIYQQTQEIALKLLSSIHSINLHWAYTMYQTLEIQWGGPFLPWPTWPGTVCFPWVILLVLLNAFCFSCIPEDTVPRVTTPRNKCILSLPFWRCHNGFLQSLGWNSNSSAWHCRDDDHLVLTQSLLTSSHLAPCCPHTSKYKSKLHPQDECLSKGILVIPSEPAWGQWGRQDYSPQRCPHPKPWNPTW